MKTTNEHLQLLQLLVPPIPKLCEGSNTRGVPRLRLGEEVYCHNGWQVS